MLFQSTRTETIFGTGTEAGERRQQDQVMKFEFFRSSQITTECDECGGPADMLKGGVCTQCRRILCYAHLHGSWARRLLADLGAGTTCVRCRASRG
jgi:hypothetical protein